MTKVRKVGSDLALSLPADIWDACLELRVALSTEKDLIIRNKYKLGLLVKRVYEYQSRVQVKGLLYKVQQFLGVSSKRVLDRAYRLVTLFTEAELNRIIESDNQGYSIGWGHLEYSMVSYLNKEQVCKYLKYARDNHLNCSALYEKIKADNERQKDPQGRKIIKTANQFSRRTTTYLDKCIEQDSYLEQLSPEQLESWVSEMTPEVKKKLADQLEQHMRTCFLLSKYFKWA